MSDAASIADLSAGRSRLKITGADRVGFLQGQCTNDVKRLQPGQSCYAAFLNAKGKMRGDAHIVCMEDAFVLEASAGLRESLEKFVITEDVVFEDLSAALGAWLVIGTLPDLPSSALTFSHPLGTGVISPVPLPVSLDAGMLEGLRIEAGTPRWGVDMDDDTIPVEAGLAGRAISYEKGCYIGQETIARIKTYGHVNRHLVQLAVAGEELPAKGVRISADNHEIGQVTSAAFVPRLGKLLALGYVRRQFAIPGARLAVGKQSAEVLKICGQ